jgi:sortase family protein
MAPVRPAPRRALRPIVLLGLLAFAVAGPPAAVAAGVARPAGATPADAATHPEAAAPVAMPRLTVAPGLLAELSDDPTLVVPGLDPVAALAPPPVPAAPSAPPRTVRPPAPPSTPPSPRLHGRNHVWSQALGLNRAVAWFSCSRSRPPDMAVYRWGCAGDNNVYLFAHAGGPFQRLHDLYVGGRLRRGMTVSYADASGRVHRYAVAWWKVVLPTAGDFAWAAQARPSMTLQTCVGANSRYRLVVRLYQVG